MVPLHTLRIIKKKLTIFLKPVHFVQEKKLNTITWTKMIKQMCEMKQAFLRHT